MVLQLARERGGGVEPVAEHHDGAHDAAALRVRGGDDGDLRDGRWRGERRLDLERPDPVAGGDDHVVAAALEEEEAVLVDARRGRRCATVPRGGGSPR